MIRTRIQKREVDVSDESQESENSSENEEEDEIIEVPKKKVQGITRGIPKDIPVIPFARTSYNSLPKISFGDGINIGYVNGGKFDGKVLKININGSTSEPATNIKTDVADFCRMIRATMGITLSEYEYGKLVDAITFRKPPTAMRIESAYRYYMEQKDKKLGRYINVGEGKIEPLLPNTYDFDDMNSRWFIAGPSGSGKSWIANKLMRSFHEDYPDSRIFIISYLDSDPSLDEGLEDTIERILLDEESFLQDPIYEESTTPSGRKKTKQYKSTKSRITPEMLENPSGDPNLIVFDDIEQTTGHVRDAVYKLKDDLLNHGRHNKINILVISHVILDGNKTKQALNETTDFCFFPNSGSKHHIVGFLGKYGGLAPKVIKQIIEIESRWVIFHRSAPQYILHERGCYFL